MARPLSMVVLQVTAVTVRLANSLLRNRTAELHGLMRNFFAARPQSNRGQNSRNYDSALHVFIS